MILRDYQETAVAAALEHFKNERKKHSALMVLPTGCHAAGTMILMYDGSQKRVEDVIFGDELMGPDSCPRIVLSLCRGREILYRITPKRGGKPFIVNAEHVLSLVSTNEGKKAVCPSHQRGGEICHISVIDYLAKSKFWKHLRKLRRSDAIDFGRANRDLPVPPWMLGVILGDGCTLFGGVSVTNPDAEILKGLRDFALAWGMGIRFADKGDNKSVSAHLIKADKKHDRRIANPLMVALRGLGLADKGCAEKFVPQCYKSAAIPHRREILAGLLDTDGSHDGCGGYDFISKSSRLAADVAFMARSLGLAVNESVASKRCQTGAGGDYYRVYISGNTDQIPCRVARKKAPARRQRKNPLVSGFGIRPVGQGEFYGFQLTGDHLYLTSDFTVHHNSGKSLVIAGVAAALNEPTLVFQPSKEILEQNYGKYLNYGLPASIYSASLNSKKIGRVTFATIGSVKNKADLFRQFKFIIIDECFTGNTEILTEHGFIPLSRLLKGTRVAQWDNQRISFVKPSAYIKRAHEGLMINFNIKYGISVPMTPGHEQIFLSKNNRFFKQVIRDARFNGRKIPVSGWAVSGEATLTPLERLCIAIQADGTLHLQAADHSTYSFTLKRERKIKRLFEICRQGNFEITEVKAGSKRRFLIKTPPVNTYKDIAMHMRYPVSREKALRIIEECVEWDGSKPKGTNIYYFSSTDERAVDFYNAVAILAGFSTYKSIQKDGRKESYKDVHRLFMQRNKLYRDCQRMSISESSYRGDVFCVKVPSGAIIVRHKGYTFITGNCHYVNARKGMYKQFLEDAGLKTVGLTATPYRLVTDGFGGSILKFLTRTRPRVFTEVIHVTQNGDLFDSGYLTTLEYKQLEGFDSSQLKLNSTGADYTDRSVQAYYERIDFSNRLTKVVMECLAKGRRNVLVFTRFVKESQRLIDNLAGLGEIVTAETAKRERENIIRRFRAGKIRVVSNVGILTHGFDFPELETVVIARPTMSMALYYQMIGRAIRIHPDKTSSWVVDLCDNYGKFGAIEDFKLTARRPGLWFIESNGRQLTNVYYGDRPWYIHPRRKAAVMTSSLGSGQDNLQNAGDNPCNSLDLPEPSGNVGAPMEMDLRERR